MKLLFHQFCEKPLHITFNIISLCNSICLHCQTTVDPINNALMFHMEDTN